MSIVSESVQKADKPQPHEGLYKAETERLRVLIDYLGRPIAAIGGADECDPDVIAADNLAREAALQAVRRAALRGTR